MAEEPRPIEELTFREAMAELDGIVGVLESNTLELEESLASYERGVKLLAALQGLSLIHIFTIDLGPYSHGFSIRDLVLLVGGAYLIYKGVSELREMLKLTEVKAAHSEEHKALHLITLPQAVGTIMVMDLVFSIDSVITAVGMADHLIIMIIAVMLAVFLMMIFIDPISNFIKMCIRDRLSHVRVARRYNTGTTPFAQAPISDFFTSR